MIRPAVYSHTLMATIVAMITLAAVSLGQGGLFRVAVHDGMAVVALGITLFVANVDPAPIEMPERRLLTLVASMITLMALTG